MNTISPDEVCHPIMFVHLKSTIEVDLLFFLFFFFLFEMINKIGLHLPQSNTSNPYAQKFCWSCLVNPTFFSPPTCFTKYEYVLVAPMLELTMDLMNLHQPPI